MNHRAFWSTFRKNKIYYFEAENFLDWNYSYVDTRRFFNASMKVYTWGTMVTSWSTDICFTMTLPSNSFCFFTSSLITHSSIISSLLNRRSFIQGIIRKEGSQIFSTFYSKLQLQKNCLMKTLKFTSTQFFNLP